jgi:aminodeoxyfutalosine synthase
MSTATVFDRRLERVTAGEGLSADEVRELASSPDILMLGMLADAARRRRHDDRATFLRVTICPWDGLPADPIPPAAREVRLSGAPSSAGAAVEAVARAREAAGDRPVAAFSLPDVAALAGSASERRALLDRLRAAGLEALAEVPLDAVDDLAGVTSELAAAGLAPVRLTVVGATGPDVLERLIEAGALRVPAGTIGSVDPLPRTRGVYRPTTGYDDVKVVALARLATPEIPTVQVDWRRYGPKLAQVALTFGADDLDGVSPSDEAPEGQRRAALSEIRRNIEAAGLVPVERDGRFTQDASRGRNP